MKANNIYCNRFLFTTVLLLGFTFYSLGGTLTSNTTTPTWNSLAGWTISTGTDLGAAGPAGDDIVINNNITLGAAVTVTSLTVNSGFTFDLNNQNFIVSGNTTIAGTITDLNVTGTNTFSGLVTINAGGTFAPATASINNFAGGISNNGVFNSAGACNFTATQPLSGSSAFAFAGSLNVTAGTLSVTTPVAITTAGALTVTSGATFDLGKAIFTASSTSSINGILTDNFGTETNTFAGLVTMAVTTGQLVSPSASTFVFKGGITHNNLTAGSFSLLGPVIFNTNNQSLSGSGSYLFGGNLTVASNTLAGGSANNMTIGGNLIVSASATFNSNQTTLIVNGTTSISGTYLDPTGPGANSFTGLVTINSGGTFNPVFSVSTFSGGIANNGTFTTGGNASAVFSGSQTLSVGNYTFGSTVAVNSGTITISATGTFLVTGTLTVAAAATLDVGTSVFTATSTSAINGTFSDNDNSGSNTFTGGVTVALTTGLFTSSSTSGFVFKSGITNNNTNASSFTVAGLSTFNTNNQNIAGSGPFVFSGGITVASFTLTGNSATTITSGALVIASGAAFNINLASFTALFTSSVSGTLSDASSTGTNTYNGLVSVNAGGIFTSVSPTNFSGGISHGGTSFNQTGACNFTGIQSLTGVSNYAFGAGVNVLTGMLTASSAVTITVTGTLSISSGASLDLGLSSFTASSIANVTGNLFDTDNTGTNTFGAVVTIATTGLFTPVSSSGFIFRGGITNGNTTAGSFSVAGLSTFNTNSQALGGSGTFAFGALTVATNTLTANNATSISVSGPLIISAGAVLDLNQSTFIALAATTISGTLNDGNSSGSNTFKGLVTITGTLNGSGSVSLFNFEGGLANNGTFTSGTSSYVFRQNPQTISGSGAVSFTNLTIGQVTDGLNIISLGRNVTTVNLVFEKGIITTAANTLTVSAGVTGAGPGNGWVNGNLNLSFGIGTSVAKTFDVGSSTDYLPVTITFPSVTTAGNVTLSTINGDHPLLSGSCISPVKRVSRYWNITIASIVPLFYNSLFTFLPSDVSGGATIANLTGAIYTAGAWNQKAIGASSPTTAQINGFTTSGAVQLAEPTIPVPVFGNGVWNAFVNNAANYSGLSGSFVTSSALSQSTNPGYFLSAASPVTAPGYVGCNVASAPYSIRLLRTNFTPGVYQLILNSNDDLADIILDGANVFSRATSSVIATVWGGNLSATSLLEIRYVNTGGPGNIDFSLAPVNTPIQTLPGTITGKQSVCSGQTPAQILGNSLAATQGSCTFTIPATPYQWQYSTDSTNWTNISLANSAGYTIPGPLTQTTWYRRGIIDNCATNYTLPVKVTVYPSAPGTPSYGNGFYNAYVYNTGTYTNYAGYFSTNSALNQKTADYYPANASPSITVGYAGCLANAVPYGVRFLRTNFADSIYQISFISNDDVADIIVNGVTVYSRNTSAVTAVAWIGRLGVSSQLEIRYNNVSATGSLDFTVVQVATPSTLTAGTVSPNQRVCSGDIPQSVLSNVITPTSGCSLINPYQWQNSADSSLWTDVSGATSLTYTIPAAVLQDTWYRRRTTDNCGRTAFSNTLKINLDNTVYGDPTVYGANQWNVYAFKSINYTNYAGYYTEPGLSFLTTSRYLQTESPSFANSYLGCQVPAINFSASMKREGVPIPGPGNVYRIDVAYLDNSGTLLIDDVQVFTRGTNVTVPLINVWTGPLDNTSNLEWRWIGNGSPNSTGLTFTEIVKPASINPGSISGNVTICAGDIPPAGFLNATLPASGCYVDYYKWQKSTNGVNWTDIASSNSASYTPTQSIYATTQYRRVVYDLCNNSASTPSVTVTIQNTFPGDPATFGSNTWHVYAFDDPTYSLYVGYYTEDNLSFDTRNRFSTFLPASSAGASGSSLGFNGCQQTSLNWSAKAKRQGLSGGPAGYYKLDINYHDDDISLFVNGTQVFQHIGCCDVHTNVWTGYVDNTTTFEYRWVNFSGPGALQTTFTYLGASPPTSLIAGTLTCYPTSFCPSDLPFVTSATPATGGCYPGYQWQKSADSTVWSDISGATSLSYNSISALSGVTYFRRKASDICSNGPVYTPGCKLNPGTAAIIPAPGNNVWNVLAYNSSNYSTNYSGYYVEPLLTFKTTNRFGSSSAPSIASGYSGCQIGAVNYSIRMLRTGFAANTYQIDIPDHDDDVLIYINGAVVFQHIGCCDAHPSVWVGILGATDIIELRYRNGGGAGNLEATFTSVVVSGGLTEGSIGGTQSICNGAAATPLTSVTPGTSFCYVNYKWESSTDNVTFSPVPGATSAIYSPGALTQTTYYKRFVYDACNRTSVPSNVIAVTVNPVVTPGSVASNQSICTSTSAASFTQSSAATGGDNIYTYQWQSSTNNVVYSNLPTASASVTYTDAPSVLTVSTYFRRVVTSCGTSVSSVPVLVTVATPTAITTQPVNFTGCTGTTAVFTIAAAGNNLTYQWYGSVNSGSTFTLLPGATASSLSVTITGVMTGNVYRYQAVVTSTCAPITASSAIVFLNVGGPTITAQPVNTTICTGGNTTFTVSGTGTSLSYQWYKNAVVIPAATNSSLTTGGINGDLFRADVTSSCGTTASGSATLTVQPAIASNTISSDQSKCALAVITALTGTVPTGGSGVYAYQWQSSVTSATGPYTIISGAVSATYTPTSVSQTTYFQRLVTSGTCLTPVASNTVTITITALPTISSQPAAAVVCPGATASYSVTATGATSYQWQQRPGSGGFVNISGANASSLSLPLVTSGMNAYTYQAIITGPSACTVTTTPVALLTVNSAPTITTQPPATATTCTGVNFTGIRVTVAGSGLVYQWQQRQNSGSVFTDIVNAGIYSNANSAILNINAGISQDGYQFQCVITGTCGSVTSNILTLTVQPAVSGNSISSPQVICEGTSPALLLGGAPAGGSGTYAYQWQISTDNNTFSNIAGAVAINYAPDTLNKDRYFRRVVNSISSNCNSSTSTALLINVDPATRILIQPSDANTCPNTNVTASLNATGGSLSYIWQVNSGAGFANINNAIRYSGYTTPTLTFIAPVMAMNNYLYRAIVTGNCAAVSSIDTSAVIALHITNAATIITEPVSSVSVCSGASTGYSVTVTVPSGTPNYQWQVKIGAGAYTNLVNSAVYSGVNSSALVLTNVTGSMNGNYYRNAITIGSCTIYSNSTRGLLTVKPLPVVVASANPSPVCTGSFSTISASGAVSYAWVSGQNTSSFSVNPSSATTYNVTGTASNGCTNTSSVTLNVNPLVTPGVIVSADVNPVCFGNAVTFTPVPTNGGANPSYLWKINGVNQTTNSPSNTSFTRSTLNNGDNFSVIMTSNAACPSSSTATGSVAMTVNQRPVLTNPSVAFLCSGTSPALSLTASIASNFTWTLGTISGSITGASSASGNSLNQILTNPGSTNAGSVIYNVTPTATASLCPGNPAAVTITVNPLPILTNALSKTSCSGLSPALGLTASIPSTFVWTTGTNIGSITGASDGSGGTLNQVLTNPSNSTPGSIVYNVTPTATTTGLCTGTSTAVTIMVTPFTFTWTGTTGTAWGTGSNWVCGVAPTASTHDVFIPNTVNKPIIPITPVAIVRDLNITGNAETLTITGSGTLQVYGNWTNAGTFAAGSGSVEFNGSTAQTISGSTATIFNNFTAANAAGITAGNITVNGILDLQAANPSSSKGVLDMGVNTLDMGGAATTTGPGDVSGIVRRRMILPNIGYTFGNEFTSATFQNIGNIPQELSYKINLGAAPTWKANGVKRVYDISYKRGTFFHGTARFHYLDSELNGISHEDELNIFHYVFPASYLAEDGKSNFNTTDNWAELANLVGSASDSLDFGTVEWTLAKQVAVSKIWYGATSSDWHNPLNWQGGIPGPLDNAIIPDAANTAFDPELPDSATIKSINIDSAGILDGNTGRLFLTGGNGAWIASGIFHYDLSLVTFTNGSATMAGQADFYNVTIKAGAVLTMSDGLYMKIFGTITNNGGWNVGFVNNTVEYGGSNQTVIKPTGGFGGYHTLVLGGSGTKTMPNAAMNIHDDFILAGSTSTTAGGPLTIGNIVNFAPGTTFSGGAFNHILNGNWNNSGTFIPGSGTITFNDTTVISGTTATNTFNNVILSASSTLISSSGITGMIVNGTLTTGANAVLDLGTTTVLSGPLSTISNNGTIKTSVLTTTSALPVPAGKVWGGTIEYSRINGGQTLVGGTYANLELRNISGSNISGGDITVSGIFALSGGTAATGPYTITLTSTGVVSRTGGHVNGNFKKWIAGTSTKTFEVGTLTDYTPMDLTFATVTTAGYVTGKSTAGDHPSINSALCLDANKSVNTYYTLTNNTAVVGSFTVAFNYPSSIIDGATTASDFMVKAYDGGIWSSFLTLNGTPSTTLTTVSGVGTFGDYQIAQSGVPTVNTPGNQTPCNGMATLLVSLGGSSISGTTYNWTNNTTGIGLAASGSSTVPSFTAIYAGAGSVTATITVSPVANGCVGNSVTYNYIITPMNYTWKGTLNSVWENGNNWSCLITPSASTHNVVIPNTIIKPIILASPTAIVGDLNITGNTETLTIAGNGALEVHGDWNNSGTFTAGTGTVEFDGTSAQTITKANSTETFYNLLINKPSGSTIIGSTTNINIAGNGSLSIISGTFDAAGRNVTLKSSAPVADMDQTARLTEVTGTLLNASNFTVERYIPVHGAYNVGTIPTSVTYRATMLAPALIGVTASGWADDIKIQGGAAGSGFAAPNVASYSTISSYSELSSGSSGINGGWRYVVQNTTSLPIGSGYRVSAGLNGLNETIKVTGTPHVGDFNKYITYTALATQGWNLIGNPYACEIDFDAFYGINSTKIEPALYILDPLNNSTTAQNNTYFYYISGSGVNIDPRTSDRPIGSAKYIPSSQAFFVKARATNPGYTLSFTENMKANASVYGNFRASTYDLIRMVISDGVVSDEAVVYFVNGATDGFDADYDAHKIATGGLNISSYSNMNTADMAINGIKEAGAVYLPIKIISKNLNECNVTISQYVNAKNRVLYIFDKLANTYKEIKQGEIINFGIIATTCTGRFYITSNAKDVITDLRDEIAPGKLFTISPNPYISGPIKVKFYGISGDDTYIEISDVKGRLLISVSTKAYSSGNEKELDIQRYISDLTAGTYIVKYKGESTYAQEKLVIIK